MTTRSMIKELIENGIKDIKCVYCNVPLTIYTATQDHIFPRSKGGSSNENNIVLSCEYCNTTKGDKTNSEIDFTKIGKFRSYRMMYLCLKQNNKIVQSSKKIYLKD